MLALCLLIIVPAAAQSVDPTLLRAAYCVGVLKESVRASDHLASGMDQPDLKADTIEASSQFRAKHKRYAEYLAP
jgi:hypothetical protein